MTEEQRRKIKNYDYLNQIALKGKTLFTDRIVSYGNISYL